MALSVRDSPNAVEKSSEGVANRPRHSPVFTVRRRRSAGFDWLAPIYGGMEMLAAGRVLQQARACWVAQLKDRRRILIAGDGHGRGAAGIAQVFPDAEIAVVEASAAMIAAGRRHVTATAGCQARVSWIHADIREWSPAGVYDAIVTQFFLDCFAPESLAQVVNRLAAAAATNAIWLLTDFAIPESPGWRRTRARAIHRLMYFFFRHATGLEASFLTPPDRLLQEAGFVMGARRTFDAGLIHADWWSLMPPPQLSSR